MILVTGGAGYIGSHTCVELLNAGHEVVVFDNFSDSHTEALKRVQAITGKTLQLVEGDFRDQKALEDTIRRFECTSIVRFTCLKAVSESVAKPLKYYDKNVIGTHRLLQAMGNCGVKALVFSSSVAVYGESQLLPPTKGHLFLATNPYGRTKLFIEEMLRDMYCSDSTWLIAILHYFNSVGVHESGLICEDPQEGIPNNLMSCVTQVAAERRESLRIWGNDHQMLDGTGGRDFIHVVDLAQGHLKAIECLDSPQCIAVNPSIGNGYSALDVVRSFRHGSAPSINFEFGQRRSGGVAACYADSTYVMSKLGWQAVRGLDEICADSWRWQIANPLGFRQGEWKLSD